MGKNLPKHETLKHQQIFELYYGMGSDRSFTELSGMTGVSRNSIAKWAQAFGWSQRILERDAAITNQVEKYGIMGASQSIALYRGLIQRLIKDFVEKYDLNDLREKLEIESVSDLEKLVKLDIALIAMTGNGRGDPAGDLQRNVQQQNNVFNVLIANGGRESVVELLQTMRSIRDELSGKRERRYRLAETQVEEQTGGA